MARDGGLFARADDAYWLDAGTPADFLQATRDLVGGVRGWPPCPGAVQVGTDLWTRGSPVVAGRALGPCFVDAGAVVADGAEIDHAVLGPGAVVESGARVTDSVLLDGARVASGA